MSKNIMYIMYDSQNPPKELSKERLYKTRGVCQAQCTRRNNWHVHSNYIPRQVELKLI